MQPNHDVNIILHGRILSHIPNKPSLPNGWWWFPSQKLYNTAKLTKLDRVKIHVKNQNCGYAINMKQIQNEPFNSQKNLLKTSTQWIVFGAKSLLWSQ